MEKSTEYINNAPMAAAIATKTMILEVFMHLKFGGANLMKKVMLFHSNLNDRRHLFIEKKIKRRFRVKEQIIPIYH